MRKQIDPEWCNAAEIKDLFGLGQPLLIQLGEAGLIKAKTIKRNVYVSRLYNIQSVREFMERNRQEVALSR